MKGNNSAAVGATIAIRRSFPIENWDGKVELRALTDFAFDPKPSTVRFHQVFRDREPQASATNLTRARHVHSVETFEDSRLVRLRNAYTGVGDRENHFSVITFPTDHDLTAGRSVLNRVVEQVLQNLGQSPAVTRYVRKLLAQVHGEP